VRELAAAANPQDLARLADAKAATVDQSSVLVEIQAQPGQATAAASAISAVGGSVKKTYHDSIDAMIPSNALLTLDGSGAVKWIDLPNTFQPTATDEALGLINAPTWQAAGLNGSGVKVAIVDGGFLGYPSLLGSALPPSVDTSCSQFSPNQGSAHGTAVAELVHDVAPGAQLYLAAINTSVDLGIAVTCLLG
jgi:hypothetical protein